MTRRIVTSARWALTAVALALVAPSALLAQTSPTTTTNPWQTAVENISEALTGPIANALSLIAIVIGGMMFAFGEGGSKRTLAGIIFGIGMAMAAAEFLTWMTG